jgi:hypothetical protein
VKELDCRKLGVKKISVEISTLYSTISNITTTTTTNTTTTTTTTTTNNNNNNNRPESGYELRSTVRVALKLL